MIHYDLTNVTQEKNILPPNKVPLKEDSSPSAIQHIIYNEFLPVLLGNGRYTRKTGLSTFTNGFSDDYNDELDPRIMNEFATAAYRIGHTLVPGIINMYVETKKRLQNGEKPELMVRSYMHVSHEFLVLNDLGGPSYFTPWCIIGVK